METNFSFFPHWLLHRCCQIMGRSEKDALTAAQIMYPLMQCADIFFLKVSMLALGNLASISNANLHMTMHYVQKEEPMKPI